MSTTICTTLDQSDPLARVTAERMIAGAVVDAFEGATSYAGVAAALLDQFAVTYEVDDGGLRRLVLRGRWEVNPAAVRGAGR